MKRFKEIYDYRQMIFSLVRKELRGRYKGSVLGFFWTFLNPLLQLLVYTMVFSTIIPFRGACSLDLLQLLRDWRCDEHFEFG